MVESFFSVGGRVGGQLVHLILAHCKKVAVGVQERVEGQDGSSLVSVLEGMVCDQRVEEGCPFLENALVKFVAKPRLKGSRRSRRNQPAIPILIRTNGLIPWPEFGHYVIVDELYIGRA